MYHVDDPINFMTSFYGCLIAGIIPVPIEPPASKDVSYSFFICFICCWCKLLEAKYFPVKHFRAEVKRIPLPDFYLHV